MYVSEEDRTTKRRVTDEDVNSEFQRALEHDPSLMIEERQRIVKNGWFGKKRTVSFFQIYHESPAPNGSAYQARYQISGSGYKDVVIAYLHGIINGSISRQIKSAVIE